jgi:hypothetical protein
MNATSTLRPSASSPSSVDGPSAMMSPASHRVAHLHQRPLVDAGVLVRALELQQVVDVDARRGVADILGRAHHDAGGASIWSTTPARLATIAAPESRATTRFHAGADERRLGRMSGTAWRCMFEPISARLASSFSRNGISAAATETSCFGETSMKSTCSGGPGGSRRPCGRETSSSRSAVLVEHSRWPARCVARLLHRREIDDLVGDLAVRTGGTASR